MNYIDKLQQSAKTAGHIGCLGLDPVVEAMPQKYAVKGIEGAVGYFTEIFKAMKEAGLIPAAIKPNIGFYAQHNLPKARIYPGNDALAQVIDEASRVFPNIPIILDYKRGDIAKSSANYANEGFNVWEADSATVSPFMGDDSVEPFAEIAMQNEAGIYVLNRTSNPGRERFQDLIQEDGRPLFLHTSDFISELAAKYPGVGAVVGATSVKEFKQIIEHYKQHGMVPLLIPGVNGQGGSAKEVRGMLREAEYDLFLARVNSASGITHPWHKREPIPKNWLEVVLGNIETLFNSLSLTDRLD